MRYLNYFLLLISIFCVTPVFADSSLPASTSVSQNLDGVIAVVNGEVITQSQLDTMFQRAKQQMAAQPNAMSDEKLKQFLLQQLINQKLQLQLAKNAKMKVSNEQVTKTIQRIAADNHLTIAQFKAKIESEGTSFSDFKKTLHDELLIHQVQQAAVANKVQVTQQDIQQFLEKYKNELDDQQRYHVIDALIPINNEKSTTEVAEAKQQAQYLLQQWKTSGKIDSNNMSDLGWQTRSTLPALFLTTLSTMKPNDIAGPILAPNGFHLIKLVAVQKTGPSTTNKTEIQNMVLQMKFQEAVDSWLKDLRKTAYIQTMN